MGFCVLPKFFGFFLGYGFGCIPKPKTHTHNFLVVNLWFGYIPKPKYLFLENVDRLLISPSGQRGRDFAIILKSLNDLGYAVEWRVVNAAEYGMPQRRRRIFIFKSAFESPRRCKRIFLNAGARWVI